MQINSLNSGSFSPVGRTSFADIKKSFDQLGSALESGNVSDAKAALEQLQKNAPSGAAAKNNPIGAKMETIQNALDSGDVATAQKAYAEIKSKMSQRPSGGGGGRPPGPPPGGAGKSGGAGSSSSSNKVYDKKDANKDGEVSWKEEQDYGLKHPDEARKTSTIAKIDSDRGLIDAKA